MILQVLFTTVIITSPIGCSMTILQLMNRVGTQYLESGRPTEFILHLLKLDTPMLFHQRSKSHPSSESDIDRIAKIFTEMLATYVKRHALRKHLLNNFSHILVSCWLLFFAIFGLYIPFAFIYRNVRLVGSISSVHSLFLSFLRYARILTFDNSAVILCQIINCI